MAKRQQSEANRAAAVRASQESGKGYETGIIEEKHEKVFEAMKNLKHNDLRNIKLQNAIKNAQMELDSEKRIGMTNIAFSMLAKLPWAKTLCEAHKNDKPYDKLLFMNSILSETSGDHRIRVLFDSKEKTVSGEQLKKKANLWKHDTAFEDRLADENCPPEAIAKIRIAKEKFDIRLQSAPIVGSKTLKNTIGFENFSQKKWAKDTKTNELKLSDGFRGIVPQVGDVRVVDVDVQKIDDNAALRSWMVSKLPPFYIDGLLMKVNADLEGRKMPKISRQDVIDGLKANNGEKGAFVKNVKFSSDMLFTRFSRCLNEMYLLDNIKFYTTGSEVPSIVNPNDVANNAYVQNKIQENIETGRVEKV
jgi:hypothetical protein